MHRDRVGATMERGVIGEKIYSRLTTAFIIRMRNWAWTNAGAGQYVPSTLCGIALGDSYGEARTPLLIGEAEDTGRALDDVPARYRQAVMLFWQYEGRELKWFARRLGQGVDYRTFERRVIEGHDLLRCALARRREQTERYQERVRLLKRY